LIFNLFHILRIRSGFLIDITRSTKSLMLSWFYINKLALVGVPLFGWPTFVLRMHSAF